VLGNAHKEAVNPSHATDAHPNSLPNRTNLLVKSPPRVSVPGDRAGFSKDTPCFSRFEWASVSFPPSSESRFVKGRRGFTTGGRGGYVRTVSGFRDVR